MAVFLKHARGSVKMVNGPWQGSPALTVRAQGMQLDKTKAIITQVGVIMNGNFQFVHCINDQVFIYVFGDRITELSVSGIAFSTSCDATNGKPGSDTVFKAYQQNKLSKTGRPVIVVLGNTRFQSFLTGMSLDLADAETQLMQFSYRFHSFPQD